MLLYTLFALFGEGWVSLLADCCHSRAPCFPWHARTSVVLAEEFDHVLSKRVRLLHRRKVAAWTQTNIHHNPTELKCTATKEEWRSNSTPCPEDIQ